MDESGKAEQKDRKRYQAGKSCWAAYPAGCISKPNGRAMIRQRSFHEICANAAVQTDVEELQRQEISMKMKVKSGNWKASGCRMMRNYRNFFRRRRQRDA